MELTNELGRPLSAGEIFPGEAFVKLRASDFPVGKSDVCVRNLEATKILKTCQLYAAKGHPFEAMKVAGTCRVAQAKLLDAWQEYGDVGYASYFNAGVSYGFREAVTHLNSIHEMEVVTRKLKSEVKRLTQSDLLSTISLREMQKQLSAAVTRANGAEDRVQEFEDMRDSGLATPLSTPHLQEVAGLKDKVREQGKLIRDLEKRLDRRTPAQPATPAADQPADLIYDMGGILLPYLRTVSEKSVDNANILSDHLKCALRQSGVTPPTWWHPLGQPHRDTSTTTLQAPVEKPSFTGMYQQRKSEGD